jgi:coenzyme F420-reducing hydrogenase delta subunit
MGYCTAAEGQKFQQEATQFDKEIKELGPSPFKSKGNTKLEAKA